MTVPKRQGPVNYGSRRTVVGAHYGMRDWLSQRVTACLMALYTVVLLGEILFRPGPMGYDKWAGIFSTQWMKLFTLVIFVSLGWHAWVGVRDIWMDVSHTAVSKQFGGLSAKVTLVLSILLTIVLGAKLFGLY